jgi:hypothetical protein
LVWARLQTQKLSIPALDPRLNLMRITAALGTGHVSSHASITTPTLIVAKPTAERGLVAPKLGCNLRDALVGFL